MASPLQWAQIFFVGNAISWAMLTKSDSLNSSLSNRVIAEDPSEYKGYSCFSKVLRRKHANIVRKFYRQQTEP